MSLRPSPFPNLALANYVWRVGTDLSQVIWGPERSNSVIPAFRDHDDGSGRHLSWFAAYPAACTTRVVFHLGVQPWPLPVRCTVVCVSSPELTVTALSLTFDRSTVYRVSVLCQTPAGGRPVTNLYRRSSCD